MHIRGKSGKRGIGLAILLTPFLLPLPTGAAFADAPAIDCPRTIAGQLTRASVNTAYDNTQGMLQSERAEVVFDSADGEMQIRLIFLNKNGDQNYSKCEDDPKRMTIHFDSDKFQSIMQMWRLATETGNRLKFSCYTETTIVAGDEVVVGQCDLE